MPELPDITVYLEQLRPRIQGQVLDRAEVASPFLLRTVEPPLGAVEGRRITELLRVGKRLV
jgi:formamidopyrimidine-DNA glycosylase